MGIPGTPHLSVLEVGVSAIRHPRLVRVALSVLQRLGDVRSVDEVGAVEVGHCPDGLENPGVSAVGRSS